MEALKQVAANTYYLPGSLNIGLYVKDNGKCILIDSGIENAAIKKVIQIAKASDWHIEAVINTHSHADHFGGNHYLQSMTGASVYATAFEAAIMENPGLEPYYLYSAAPIKELQIKFIKGRPCHVDHIISEGPLDISGTVFEILSLKGHSADHIGVVTPDHICFTGDALTPQVVIDKYKIPYYDDIGNALYTLEKLKQTRYSRYVLGHHGMYENIDKLADMNRTVLLSIGETIAHMLEKPMTREGLLEALVEEFDIPLNIVQYYLLNSSVSAYLTYLHEKNRVRPYVEKNQLLWCKIHS